MLTLTILAVLLAAPQRPSDSPAPELATLKAGLGDCSADFTVKDGEGEPVYAATIHVRVRYGMLGIKRADLEVGTNSDGKARIEGLPAKARPLSYTVEKDGRKAALEQDVAATCRGKYDVTLK